MHAFALAGAAPMAEPAAIKSCDASWTRELEATTRIELVYTVLQFFGNYTG
jgi:hypothetical protein